MKKKPTKLSKKEIKLINNRLLIMKGRVETLKELQQEIEEKLDYTFIEMASIMDTI